MSGQFDKVENNEPFALLESVKRSALQLRLLIEPQQTLRELLVKFFGRVEEDSYSIQTPYGIMDHNYPPILYQG